jgi:hypothetical protein
MQFSERRTAVAGLLFLLFFYYHSDPLEHLYFFFQILK